MITHLCELLYEIYSDYDITLFINIFCLFISNVNDFLKEYTLNYHIHHKQIQCFYYCKCVISNNSSAAQSNTLFMRVLRSSVVSTLLLFAVDCYYFSSLCWDTYSQLKCVRKYVFPFSPLITHRNQSQCTMHISIHNSA